MWGFIHKQGGPLGERNRELVMPKECWAMREMPTPGSAPSKSAQYGKDLAKRPASTGGIGGSRPDSGGTLAPLSASEEFALRSGRAKDQDSSQSEVPERRVAFRMHNASKGRPAKQDLSRPATPSATGDDAERRMPPLGRSSRLRATAGSDARKAMRRHRSDACRGGLASTIGSTVSDGSLGRQVTPPAPRRLLGMGGSVSLEGTLERRNATGGSPPLSRTTTAPARLNSRAGGLAQHPLTGASAALEGDLKYQEALLAEWKRALAAEPKIDVVQNKQLCQFFDFLSDNAKEALMPGAQRYIHEAIGDIEQLEAEMRRGAPTFEADGVEFTSMQKDRLKSVLKLFAQVSRPMAKATEVIYRPTFCRFLLDTGLVAMDKISAYHEVTRHFDVVARTSSDVNDKDKGQGLSFGAQRYATLEQCVTIVSQLLGTQATVTGSLAFPDCWFKLEKGLQEAQRLMLAILTESKRRAQKQSRLAESESTDEAIMKWRMLTFEHHGSPPQFFDGSLRDWSKGLRFWVDSTTMLCGPESVAERCQQQAAVECHVRDMLIEPGCVHVCKKFGYLFKTLFDGYFDEMRERIVEEDDGSTRREIVQHMSYAAFFRFCTDFTVFPVLCSFDEAWAAYRSADAVIPTGDADMAVSDRLRRAYRRASVIAMLRARKLEKRSSSRSSARSGDSQTQTTNTSSSVRSDVCPCGSEYMPDSLFCRKCGRQRFQVLITGKDEGAHRNPGKDDPLPRNPGKEESPHRSTGKEDLPHRNYGKEDAQQRSSFDSLDAVFGRPAVTLQAPPMPHRRLSGTGIALQVPLDASAKRSVTGGLKNRSTPQLKITVETNISSSPRAKRSMTETPHISSPRPPEREGSIFSGDESEAADDPPRPPRLKVSSDFSWLRKPYSLMTERELNIYSILSTLNECVLDRFLHVRGLFTVFNPQYNDGLVNVEGMMNFFDWLRICHPLNRPELEDFMLTVDPNSDGMLDPAELEKAVDTVRQDHVRRGLVEKGSSTITGGALLGEEARRLSHRATKFSGAHGEVKAAFGLAAFTESLLLLGFQHMHADGKAIKSAAPGGVKGLWLVAFLHCRFDQLMRDRDSRRDTAGKQPPELPLPLPGDKDAQSQSNSSTPDSVKKTWSLPTLSLDFSRQSLDDASVTLPEGRPRSKSRPLLSPTTLSAWARRESASGPDNLLAVPGSGTSPRNKAPPPLVKKLQRLSIVKASTVLSLEPSPMTPKAAPPVPAPPHSAFRELELKPTRSKYTSFVARLLEEHPDMFRRSRISGSQEPRKCHVCGKQRDEQGLGSVFCHACSGVDDRPLNESILFPVFERRRCRWELKELRRAGSKEHLVSPASRRTSKEVDTRRTSKEVDTPPDDTGSFARELSSSRRMSRKSTKSGWPW